MRLLFSPNNYITGGAIEHAVIIMVLSPYPVPSSTSLVVEQLRTQERCFIYALAWHTKKRGVVVFGAPQRVTSFVFFFRYFSAVGRAPPR